MPEGKSKRGPGREGGDKALESLVPDPSVRTRAETNMKTSRPSHPRGFTLMELLTVIAIVGILAALIFPTVGKVRETAQRTVDANNLREIAKAALLYAADNNDRLPDPAALASQYPGLGAGPYAWAGILAQRGIVTDPAFYFAKNDPLFSGSYPTAIVDPSNRSALSSEFGGRILSFEFVGGLRISDGPNVPIAFTRGLQVTGRWDPASGAYKDTGGHIAFLGGNVQFFPNVAEADSRLTLTNGAKGSSIRQAIPPHARIYATPPEAGPTVGSLSGTTGQPP